MTSTSRTARRALPALALAAVAALVTGCGPNTPTTPAPTASASATGGTGTPTATPTPTSPPATPTPTPTSPATPVPTSTGTVGAAAAPCATRDLQAAIGDGQGAAGSTYIDLDFKNISGKVCTLYGYPGVSQAGGHPVTEIGPAASRSTDSPRVRVTLLPGTTAHALLRLVDAANFDTATCHPKAASYFQIFPPNQTTPIYLAHTSAACASVGLLTVSTVLPGVGTAAS